MIPIFCYPKREQWQKLTMRPTIDNALIEPEVAKILLDIKKNGSEAVRRYATIFDGVSSAQLQINAEELRTKASEVDSKLADAISTAYSNIEVFHKAQLRETTFIETMPGVLCWRKGIAIERVGIYIPGGTAPLFSTVLMLGIPAKIAGCKEIILCTPPNKYYSIHPAIAYAAELIGINTVFTIGGIQAIGSMAYGTTEMSKADKIFGPGNQYVTCAKQLVSKDGVAIDLPAGPSELAVIADESCNPEFVAADLLSQAEHGIDSHVILVSDNELVIQKVLLAVEEQLTKLPRCEIAAKALKNSKAFLMYDIAEGIELINTYAPEHLIIACQNDEDIVKRIINAGSVFVGNYSPESAGDYASGTNHTLPTNGYANAYSGVSVDSFLKYITFQKITKDGLKSIAEAIETMAQAEGLEAHKNAVSIRFKE